MSNGTILLIEDDEDIRESIRILLESENYIIHEAENGKRGLELLSEETDLVIPYNTCKLLRWVSALSTIPTNCSAASQLPHF